MYWAVTGVANSATVIHRETAAKGQAPAQKLAATTDILKQILAPLVSSGFATVRFS